MSPENSPSARSIPTTPPMPPAMGHNGGPSWEEYWFALIGEKEAARFLGLTVRTLQKYRQTGNGPNFFRLSGRCVRYQRFEMHRYNEARKRASTSDPGPETAAA